MVRSGVIALAILVFSMSWNEYLFALFLAGSDAQPLTVGITLSRREGRSAKGHLHSSTRIR